MIVEHRGVGKWKACSLISSSFLFFILFFSNYWFKYAGLCFSLTLHILIDARLTHSANVDLTATPRWVTWLRVVTWLSQLADWPDSARVAAAWHSYASSHTTPTQSKLKSKVEVVTLTDSIQCDICYLHKEWRSTRQRSKKMLCKQFPWK